VILDEVVEQIIENWAIDDLLERDAADLIAAVFVDPSLLLEMADTAGRVWGTDEKPLAEALAWHIIECRRPEDRRWPG